MQCPHCKKEIIDQANFCNHCGKSARKSHAGKILLAVFGALFVLLVIAFLNQPAGSPPNPANLDPSGHMPYGTEARLIYEANDNIPVFVSELALQEEQDAVRRNDKTALATLILDKKTYIVPAGTHVSLRGFGVPGVRQVRISGSGDVWVMSKMIQPLRK